MPSAIVTSLLIPLTDPQPLVAEVLGADASATTYLLNCPSGTDSNDCGTYNESITLGPWASRTLPPGAAGTGLFDLSIDMKDTEEEWKFSIHCEMSRTVAQECTTINIGGNDDGSPTATFSSPEELEDQDLATFAYMPVTITAGQDLLTAFTTAAATDSTSISGQSTASNTASTTGSSNEASGTETPTSSAASPEKTNGAASCIIRVLTAMSMAGIATAIVLS
ncbi:Fc.00g012150.m01.CDS01 [Cosmosporella sp. VM-42]